MSVYSKGKLTTYSLPVIVNCELCARDQINKSPPAHNCGIVPDWQADTSHMYLCTTLTDWWLTHCGAVCCQLAPPLTRWPLWQQETTGQIAQGPQSKEADITSPGHHQAPVARIKQKHVMTQGQYKHQQRPHRWWGMGQENPILDPTMVR